MIESDSSLVEQRLLRLQQFLELDPGNDFLRQDIFALALAASRHALAQEQIEAGLGQDANSVDWRYRQSLLASAKADFAGAEAVLSLLIAEGHGTPPLLYQLAYVQFCQGKSLPAMAPLQYLVAHALMEQPQALPLLMRCLQREGYVSEALRLFRDHIDGSNEIGVPAEAWGLAAVMAIDVESIDEADAWSRQALRLHPYQCEGLIGQGTLALGRQDVTTAKKHLEQAIQRYPESGRCWSALGLTYLMAQELPPAEAALERATMLMPSHIGTWHGLGWCRIVEKNFVAARLAFEQALELDRNFSESHGGMAVVLAMLQQKLLSQEHIARALRLDPRCVSALFAEALLKGEGGDTASFRRMATRLLGQRKTLTGESMAEVVLRQRG